MIPKKRCRRFALPPHSKERLAKCVLSFLHRLARRAMAFLTTQFDCSKASRACGSSAWVSWRTMRTARSRSLVLLGSRSTIRLPTTFPICTIASVVMMLRMSLVAVPLFRRVEPVNSSGPIFGLMTAFGLLPRGIFSVGLKQSSAVFAPRLLASQMPPQMNGVRPLAAMPMKTSCLPISRKRTASAPASALSSAPSTA